jgi:histidinol-phosphate aminotransferase
MTFSFKSIAKPSLYLLNPYQPGKPIEEVKREFGIQNVIKLASNENALGPSQLALRAAKKALKQTALYPDGSGYILKQALSKHLKVDATHITLGAGSDQVMFYIAQTFAEKGDEIIISQYAFATYEIIAHMVQAIPIIVPAKHWEHNLEAMANALTSKTKLIFIANPNNPTGGYINEKNLKQFLKNIPKHVLIILDEAYYEYVHLHDYPNTLNLQKTYPNLITTRSFSKIYGLAGLRVGYGISHPEIAQILERARLPFNLSTPALFAASGALEDQTHVQRTLVMTAEGMSQLQDGLNRLGLKYLPSVANFLTVDLNRLAIPIYKSLLHAGVIIRPLTNYGMPKHIRVTAGLPRENKRFLTILKRVLRTF